MKKFIFCAVLFNKNKVTVARGVFRAPINI